MGVSAAKGCRSWPISSECGVQLTLWLKIAVSWFGETLRSGQFWIGVPTGLLVGGAILALVRSRRYQATQVHLNLPFGLGNVTYETADQGRKLAWKMYVHLKTRKAALPFDEKSDVVADVYDSLHEVFAITRDLLVDADLAEVGPEGVPELLLRALNDGLRPHLTTWQASFSRWWEVALASQANAGKTPQEIQRQYPQFDALLADLRLMNSELTKYAGDLLIIARAPKGQRIRITEVVDAAPVDAPMLRQKAASATAGADTASCVAAAKTNVSTEASSNDDARS